MATITMTQQPMLTARREAWLWLLATIASRPGVTVRELLGHLPSKTRAGHQLRMQSMESMGLITREMPPRGGHRWRATDRGRAELAAHGLA